MVTITEHLFTKYKDYTFTQNPYQFSVEQKKDIYRTFVPTYGYVANELGQGYKVVSGDGFFHGQACLEEFEKLDAIFNQKDSGMLFLPGLDPFYAYFTKLVLQNIHSPNVIEYTFEFSEDTQRNLL